MDNYKVKGKKIYFIGIGGIHMSGLAELCQLFGASVAGSDAKQTEITDRLSSLGIPVTIGHSPNNIDPSADLIVYTSAVKPENPEFMRAKELSLPITDKAGLLSQVMKNYKNRICVSGSHGKTSTTAMIAETLHGLNLNPTIMNGGLCTRLNAAMVMGGTEYFVAEADEYYDAFLKMNPSIGVILNISHDHADYYPTYESLLQSFRRFAELIEKDGVLIVNGEIKDLNKLTEKLECRVITYGGKSSDWQANQIQYDQLGHPSFQAKYKGHDMGIVKLSVPGIHNVQNALASMAVCNVLGMLMRNVTPELLKFKGAARRFQYRGIIKGADIYDDYAHHPAEIRATLEAAKNMKKGRIICAFQPHTRSRTQELFDDFAASFKNADKIIFLPIFTPSGREEGHINISSADLCRRLTEQGQDAVIQNSFKEAALYLYNLCQPEDIVIIMGAGDIYNMTPVLTSYE